ANPMVWASDYYPKKLLKPIPSWIRELTHDPAA
ncbi:MAG: ferritin-like domain-containing protein, partial [Mycobacterium sp.]